MQRQRGHNNRHESETKFCVSNLEFSLVARAQPQASGTAAATMQLFVQFWNWIGIIRISLNGVMQFMFCHRRLALAYVIVGEKYDIQRIECAWSDSGRHDWPTHILAIRADNTYNDINYIHHYGSWHRPQATTISLQMRLNAEHGQSVAMEMLIFRLTLLTTWKRKGKRPEQCWSK